MQTIDQAMQDKVLAVARAGMTSAEAIGFFRVSLGLYYLAGLMTSPVAKNMINTFFFNLNAIKSGQSRPKDAPRFKPQKVGVLGAGMMGAGIAWAQASRGIATVLKDVSTEKAEAGKAYSAKLTQARVDEGRMTAEAQQALLSRITPTASACWN